MKRTTKPHLNLGSHTTCTVYIICCHVTIWKVGQNFGTTSGYVIIGGSILDCYLEPCRRTLLLTSQECNIYTFYFYFVPKEILHTE